VAGLALLVGACGPDLVIDGITLEDTRWRAIGVAGLPPVVGHEPTLAFEGGPISGSAGCNDYSWTYRSLPGGGIIVSGLSQSVRECEGGDPILARVEERYLSALKAGRRMDIVDGRLEISTGLGTLVFEPMGGTDEPIR
jgi:heat shock protein HslJ